MTDAISRSAVLEMAYCAIKPTQDNPPVVSVVSVEDIEDLPALDVAPVVHARWDKKTTWYGLYGQNYMVCSECGKRYEFHSSFNYCPNCGARMDGEADG